MHGRLLRGARSCPAGYVELLYHDNPGRLRQKRWRGNNQLGGEESHLFEGACQLRAPSLPAPRRGAGGRYPEVLAPRIRTPHGLERGRDAPFWFNGRSQQRLREGLLDARARAHLRFMEESRPALPKCHGSYMQHPRRVKLRRSRRLKTTGESTPLERQGLLASIGALTVREEVLYDVAEDSGELSPRPAFRGATTTGVSEDAKPVCPQGILESRRNHVAAGVQPGRLVNNARVRRARIPQVGIVTALAVAVTHRAPRGLVLEKSSPPGLNFDRVFRGKSRESLPRQRRYRSLKGPHTYGTRRIHGVPAA